MFNTISKKLIKATDTLFARSARPLLNGDLVTAGERWFPREQHPSMWLKIPQDMKRSLLWHGKLIDGSSPAYLCQDKMTDPVAAYILAQAMKKAFKYTTILASGVAALSLPVFGYALDTLPAFPTWAIDSGSYFAAVTWIASAAASMAWTFASVVISNGWPLALLFPVFAWYAFWDGLQTFWDSVSNDMRRPTLDALAFWDHQAQRRGEEYTAYQHVVSDIDKRLKFMPFFPFGVSTGMMAANGVSNAPLKGAYLGYDGDSARRHTMIFGDTGTGKTRLVLEPLYVNMVVNSEWPDGHKIGAYITDGKGVLWKDLYKHSGRRKDEVRIVGVGADHYGIDLLKGMTPPQVSEAILGVAQQMGKGSGGKDDFWIKKGASIIKNNAYLALAMETNAEVLADFMRVEGCRPYSLLGIYKLSIDEQASKQAIKVVQDTLNADDGADRDVTRKLRKAVVAGLWLTTQYHNIAENTKSGFTSNVSDLLDLIEDDEALCERFCTGTYRADRLIDVDYCLKGGITMLAVGGGTGEGEFGKFIAIWLKTRVMQTARMRNAADPDECKRVSCAMFADEYQSLVTVGSLNSCQHFWNVGRSSGLYLVAATQSLSAIEQTIGKVATENIMSNMSTRVLLKTKDKGTLMYYQELLGKSLQAVSSIPGVYSNHEAIKEKFGEPRPRFEIAKWAGLAPTDYTATISVRDAYNIDHLIAMNEQQPIEKQESYLSLRKRQEDMIAKATSEANQFHFKIDMDRMMSGAGYALVMAERGDGSRVDFVDLKPIRAELEASGAIAA